MNAKDEMTTLDEAISGDLPGKKSGKDPESSEPRSERSGLFAGFALFLALGALALSGLMWLEMHDGADQADPAVETSLQQLQQSQSSQSRDLADLSQRLESLSSGLSQEDISQLSASLSQQLARLNGLQEALDNQQRYNRSLQQAIDSLQVRLKIAETGLASTAPSANSAPAQLDMATVEYLLRLAPERLALFHDVRAADQALVQADTQLAAMDNPIYIGLRQHIADARQVLAATELPNPIEISARLDDAQARLASLTFGGQSNVTGQPGSGGDEASQADAGWWERLKGSLASLVTVRRSATDVSERLTIEDKDLLRQGLWMQLEGARLALMRHDQASWQDTLSRAMGVLERWFDSSSPEYRALHDELTALAGLAVSPVLPDISGPWAQLQLIRQAAGTPVSPAPAAPETATQAPAATDDSVEQSGAAPESAPEAEAESPETGEAGPGEETIEDTSGQADIS